MQTLKAPFPYFGGKRTVAAQVWERFGNTVNYVEPFAGSLAVLLARPHTPGTETVNDANAFLCNFWRALQADPDGVAQYADWPVNECDLHARHCWLMNIGAEHVARCKQDPDYFDVKVAGWWVWGVGLWIGTGWCDAKSLRSDGMFTQQIFATDRMGVHKFKESPAELKAHLRDLSKRLKITRVACGDWTRCLGYSFTSRNGATSVFLDPPYSEAERAGVYSVETPGVAADVRAWCLANGNESKLRIALCGYAGEGHEALEAAGWECVAWKAAGGYGSQGTGRGRENANRERIWFSPHCLKPGLFGDLLHEPERAAS